MQAARSSMRRSSSTRTGFTVLTAAAITAAPTASNTAPTTGATQISAAGSTQEQVRAASFGGAAILPITPMYRAAIMNTTAKPAF